MNHIKRVRCENIINWRFWCEGLQIFKKIIIFFILCNTSLLGILKGFKLKMDIPLVRQRCFLCNWFTSNKTEMLALRTMLVQGTASKQSGQSDGGRCGASFSVSLFQWGSVMCAATCLHLDFSILKLGKWFMSASLSSSSYAKETLLVNVSQQRFVSQWLFFLQIACSLYFKYCLFEIIIKVHYLNHLYYLCL